MIIYFLYSLRDIRDKSRYNDYEDRLLTTLNKLGEDIVKPKVSSPSMEKLFLERIYNPLKGPDVSVPSGSLRYPGYDAYTQYQMLGYVYNNTNRYPIFGRFRDPNRSDRWEYYISDDSRNHIKIPIVTKNYQELYDGDNINITELNSSFTFKKYDNQDDFRYNPNSI